MKRVLLLCMIVLMTACSTDDVQERNSTNERYTLVYTTGELPDFVTIQVGTEITYNENFEVIDSEYNDVTNTVTVEIQPGATKIDSNLYIENGSEVSIILYNSEGNIVTEQIIEQINYNYIYNF